MAYWITTVLVMIVLGVYAWYMRHPTVEAVLNGKITLPDREAAALEGLLADAGVPPGRVRVVYADPDTPCWSYAYRNWWESKLWVYRRFGRFGENCIGVDRGQVIGFSLVDTHLADMTPLADLEALLHLQLRDARIKILAGLPIECRWKEVNLAQNALTDCKALTRCTALERLDISFNRLTVLPNLQPVSRLERLDAHSNELHEVTGLANHPSLTWVHLGANRLRSADGLHGLPHLDTLLLGSNALTTLQGLNNLPALRSLHVYANQLQTLNLPPDSPALQWINIDGNPLQTMPEGYTYTGRGLHPTTITPVDAACPKVELDGTPLAETLQTQARQNHDGTAVYATLQLPRGRGRAQGVTSRGSTGFTPFSSKIAYEGTMIWLNGTYTQDFKVHQALDVTVTASVEKGRLRAYLADSQGGYSYAEGIPGKPLQLSGRLLTGASTYLVMLESIEGHAEGIQWTVQG